MSQARLQLQLSVAENIYRFSCNVRTKLVLQRQQHFQIFVSWIPRMSYLSTNPPNQKDIKLCGRNFLGLFSGVGLALLFDNLDTTIKGVEDIEKIKQVSFLGIIPKIKKGTPLLISRRKYTDPICEAYRTVKNSVRFSSLDKPLRHILITSAEPQEGKTLMSVNLSIALIREGKRVLLIDTDLRKPGVHKHFNIENTIGLTSVLLGEKEVKDVIFDTGLEGLCVMPTGPTPPDPPGYWNLTRCSN